jgi:soluble P-type ATPase
VKLPISSQGKESRRWVGGRVVEEGVPVKWKKKQEVKKEIRKKMKMRIIKKLKKPYIIIIIIIIHNCRLEIN